MNSEILTSLGAILVPILTLLVGVRLLPKKDASDILKGDLATLATHYREEFERLEARVQKVIDENDFLKEENFELRMNNEKQRMKINELEQRILELEHKQREKKPNRMYE